MMRTEPSPATIGERCAAARTKLGISQETLATLAGLSAGTIGNLEIGRSKTLRKLTTVARVLGVSPQWLAEGTTTTAAAQGAPVPPGTTPAVALHDVLYLDPKEAAFIATWRTAPPDMRVAIDTVFAMAAKPRRAKRSA
jgi:transcriptional regulator with XRE-family HTH domain